MPTSCLFIGVPGMRPAQVTYLQSHPACVVELGCCCCRCIKLLLSETRKTAGHAISLSSILILWLLYYWICRKSDTVHWMQTCGIWHWSVAFCLLCYELNRLGCPLLLNRTCRNGPSRRRDLLPCRAGPSEFLGRLQLPLFAGLRWWRHAECRHRMVLWSETDRDEQPRRDVGGFGFLDSVRSSRCGNPVEIRRYRQRQ